MVRLDQNTKEVFLHGLGPVGVSLICVPALDIIEATDPR